MTSKVPPVWKPAPYKYREAIAIKALSEGTATEEQQGLAVRWIIEQAANTYDISFRSDADGGDRDTAFAEGRRFVGLSLVKMINLPGPVLAELRKQEGLE